MAADAAPPAWFDLDDDRLGELAEDETQTVTVDGRALIVARAEGNLLAFIDSCSACGSALGEAALAEGTLTCPECERRYFLPRAGRSLDDERLLLEPVPLLAGSGRPRVALPA